VKVAVVDGTGKLVATDTIYPHTGQAAKAAAVAALCESTTLSWWRSATVPPRVKPSVSSST
jgi:transcriptional accessory protein Tex/SPT6